VDRVERLAEICVAQLGGTHPITKAAVANRRTVEQIGLSDAIRKWQEVDIDLPLV
jgi:hypothetical protein